MEMEQIKRWIDRYESATFTVNKNIDLIIRESVDQELTIEQFSIIRYLSKHSRCTTTELSEVFLVHKGAITSIVTRLHEKKLIKRMRDRKDRRVLHLSLTDKGQQVYEEAASKIHERIAVYLSHFKADEIVSYIESYEKLARLMMNDDRTKDGEVVT